mmetsp:Transcript_16067/g.39614  ORF Transcript_16067/g.39614 Transcript_16067/m.39614 type:complete len:262 (-) Transcript_16067:106-891(-)
MFLLRSVALVTLLVGFSSLGLTAVSASSVAATTFEDGLPTPADADDSNTTVRRRAATTTTRSHRRMTDGKGRGKKATPSSSSKKKMSKKSSSKGKSSTAPTSAPAGPSDNTIAGIACSTPGFEILCSLVVAAGLDDDLASPGPFTVFAPTNNAFTNFLDATGINIPDPIPPNDPLLGTITNILLYHVVSGEVLKSDLVCDAAVPTLLGKDSQTQCLNVDMGEQSFFQIGDATLPLLPPQIVMFDIRATNGIIHVVNNVILP